MSEVAAGILLAWFIRALVGATVAHYILRTRLEGTLLPWWLLVLRMFGGRP